jgi:DNA-binding response OmpR family regulator
MTASGKLTVAIVNDEPGILQAVRCRLESEGYDVRAYANTADALELISKPADVALLDGSNHPFDGIELYRRLRGSASMPVIFLSAWAHEIPSELERKGLPSAEAYVTCPFTFDELLATIQTVLSESK